jgi:NAD(P)-dependent dehydrogenase (short-subunit alcohol dehydrogenase family)
MIDFKNKKILVTGATGGIGREIVKKFIFLEGNVLATGTNIEKLDLQNLQLKDSLIKARETLRAEVENKDIKKEVIEYRDPFSTLCQSEINNRDNGLLDRQYAWNNLAKDSE